MPSASAEDSKTAPLISAPAKLATAMSEFPQFPALPAELQDLVFENALFRQLIQVDLEGGNLVWEWTIEDRSRILIPKSLNNHLWSVCRDSRAIVLKKLGEDHGFVCRNRGNSFPEDPPAGISPPISFRPQVDTLFFPDLMPFIHMIWDGSFGKVRKSGTALAEGVGIKHRDYTDIHSLVLGGCIERALEKIDDIQFSDFPSHSPISGSGIISKLPKLQELILVSPTVQQLCERSQALQNFDTMTGRNTAMEAQDPEWNAFGKILSNDILETRQHIEEMLRSLQTDLKAEGKRELEYQMDLHGIKDPTEFSDFLPLTDWWKNPVVTWLTEDELKTRFGLDLAIDLKTGPQIPALQ